MLTNWSLALDLPDYVENPLRRVSREWRLLDANARTAKLRSSSKHMPPWTAGVSTHTGDSQGDHWLQTENPISKTKIEPGRDRRIFDLL